jgi:hypothetical protein
MQPPVQIRRNPQQLLNTRVQRHNCAMQHGLREQRTPATRKQGWEDVIQRRADSLWLTFPLISLLP